MGIISSIGSRREIHAKNVKFVAWFRFSHGLSEDVPLIRVVLINIYFVLTSVLSAETLVGPFLPDSGHYTVVPGGDFESAKSVSSEGWTGYFSFTGSAVFQISSELPYHGTNSLKSLVRIVTSQSNPQFQSLQRTVDLRERESYVLSAFFHTAAMSGSMYVDLADARFEPRGAGTIDPVRAEGGIHAWQFSWAIFTIPSSVTNVIVRLKHEGFSRVGEYGYVDDIAVTPLQEFVPPVPITSQEPSLQLGIFAGIRLEGTIGRPYRIEYSTTLRSTNWLALTNLFLPSSPYFFLDLTSENTTRRFYRASPIQ